MAKIAISPNNNLVISSLNKIRVYKSDSIEYQELEVSGKVTSLQFSPSGRHFAAASEDKQLHLWESEGDWKLLSSRKLVRRSQRLVFSQDHLLVADRTGYVTRFSVTTDPTSPGSSLLGHCSMLLDMVLSEDGKFVVTADRDEKIRVSHFPRSYDIHTYCLGHLEFVSNIASVPGHPSWLVSASGDETLRLWDFSVSGTLKSSRNYREDCSIKTEGDHLPPKHLVCTSHPLVLLFPDGADVCLVYALDGKDQLTLRQCHSLPAVAWDVCLGPQDSLWVVLSTGLVQVFHILLPGKLELEASSIPLLQHLEQDLKSFFEGCLPPEPVASLYKRSYDNQSIYLKRKKEREERLVAKRLKLFNFAKYMPPECPT